MGILIIFIVFGLVTSYRGGVAGISNDHKLEKNYHIFDLLIKEILLVEDLLKVLCN